MNAVRDLRDRLQVGRPEPERPADRRARTGRCSRRRPSSPRTCSNFEVGHQDRAVPRRHRERDGLRHRHQGLPDAGRQRERRRAARLSRQRREGARARRRVRRQRAGRAATCRSTAPSPTPTATTSRSPMRRRRSRTPAGRRSRTSPARCCRASPSGRCRSAASTPHARHRASASAGEFFGALDASYRSSFSSSASVLALSRGRRLLAGQRARRVPLQRRLDAVRSGRATC